MTKSQEIALVKVGAIVQPLPEVERVNSIEDLGQNDSFKGSMGHLRLLTKSSEELPDVNELIQLENIKSKNKPKNYIMPTIKHQNLYNELKIAKIRERISHSFC